MYYYILGIVLILVGALCIWCVRQNKKSLQYKGAADNATILYVASGLLISGGIYVFFKFKPWY
jgi:hypothetical protein